MYVSSWHDILVPNFLLWISLRFYLCSYLTHLTKCRNMRNSNCQTLRIGDIWRFLWNSSLSSNQVWSIGQQLLFFSYIFFCFLFFYGGVLLHILLDFFFLCNYKCNVIFFKKWLLMLFLRKKAYVQIIIFCFVFLYNLGSTWVYKSMH